MPKTHEIKIWPSQFDAVVSGHKTFEWRKNDRDYFRYRCVWDSINGKKHPWESNPWVWAITFKKAAVEAR